MNTTHLEIFGVFSFEDWYEEGMYSELWELSSEALTIMYEAYVRDCLGIDGPVPDLTYDLAWESEMQEEWGMTCSSPMCDELKAQEADSEEAS